MFCSARLLKGLSTALAVTVLVAACGGSGEGAGPEPQPDPEPQFIPEGLSGRKVEKIFRVGDELLAATDTGIYGKGISQSGWQHVALRDYRVVDLAIISENRWLATVFDAGPDSMTNPQLLETVNRGSNWQAVKNDFGGGFPDDEPMHALLFDAETETLFATGNDALARSADFGRGWELIDGIWSALAPAKSALSLNAQKRQIWYGGESAIEQLVLRRYDLAEAEARQFPSDLLPNPATVKGFAFDPEDPNRILASGEGGILVSGDNGESWRRPLGDVDYRFYFDVVFDPQDRRTLYTAGWDKGETVQPLILEVSHDGGETFRSYEYADDQLRGGALSMLVLTEAGETSLYIGLDGGGIVKVLNPSGGAR